MNLTKKNFLSIIEILCVAILFIICIYNCVIDFCPQSLFEVSLSFLIVLMEIVVLKFEKKINEQSKEIEKLKNEFKARS